MKLHEIAQFGKPEKSSESLSSYEERLRDIGTRRIGAGLHATVHRHPKYKTIVVKVSSEGWKKGGPLVYLQYAMQHQDNPHVPKIYGVRRFTNKDGGNYFIAFIEKLDEYIKLRYKQKKIILQKYFGELANKDIDGWELSVYYLRELRAQAAKTGVPNKHLLEVLSFIRERGTKDRAIDLHDGNIMMRGNVPVITDPLT